MTETSREKKEFMLDIYVRIANTLQVLLYLPFLVKEPK